MVFFFFRLFYSQIKFHTTITLEEKLTCVRFDYKIYLFVISKCWIFFYLGKTVKFFFIQISAKYSLQINANYVSV